MFGKKKTYDFYLAGGMRGYPNLNKAMFTLVAGMLRAEGFTVWSPSEQDSYLKRSFAQCMILDLNAIINDCRKIALLPGWRESLGANVEMFCAFATGKEAVEVRLSKDETEMYLAPMVHGDYVLPYKDGVTRSFNPHNCSLDSFEEV